MLSDKLVERLTMLGAMLDEEQRINHKLAYPLTRLLSVITTEGMPPGTPAATGVAAGGGMPY